MGLSGGLGTGFGQQAATEASQAAILTMSLKCLGLLLFLIVSASGAGDESCGISGTNTARAKDKDSTYCPQYNDVNHTVIYSSLVVQRRSSKKMIPGRMTDVENAQVIFSLIEDDCDYYLGLLSCAMDCKPGFWTTSTYDPPGGSREILLCPGFYDDLIEACLARQECRDSDTNCWENDNLCVAAWSSKNDFLTGSNYVSQDTDYCFDSAHALPFVTALVGLTF